MAQRAPANASSARRPRVAEPTHLAGLGNRFVEILARKLSRQDFAVEIALLVAAATQARAVGVLGWEPARERLRLLGECGLSDDARGALGNAGDCPWDIPVRGLRNRRISVIAAAHQNPFVPRGIVGMSPAGLCIASLPIYDEREPIGVLLLLAAGNRTFPDVQLQTLSQALRVCARGLQDPGGAAARTGSAARDTAHIAAAIAELAGDSAPEAPDPAVAETPRPRDEPAADERVPHLEQHVAQLREELERTAAKLRSATVSSNALVRERDQLAQRVAELDNAGESAASELRAELGVLQERLLAVESERARYQRVAEDRHTRHQQTIATLGGERDALLERVQAAESKLSVLDGELAAVTGERARLSAQIENVTGQLHATQETLARAHARHDEDRTALESDRDGWKEQASALRRQLTQRTEELGALDRELRSTVVARDGAGAQLQAARAELERLSVLSDDTGRALAGAEAARAGVGAELTALRQQIEGERAVQAAREQQLRADLEARLAESDTLRHELDAAGAELAARNQALVARDEQLARLRLEQTRAQDAEATWLETAAAHRAESATLTATVEQLTAARQQLLDDRTALRSAVAEARQRATEAEVAHAATVGELQSDAAQLRRQVDALTAERVALAGRLERAVAEGKTQGRGLAEAHRCAEDLTERLRQRETAAAAAAAEREQLAAQVAALTGQLQADHDARQRAQARDALERAALESDRDEWKEQAAQARAELTQTTDRVIALEGELRGATVARDTTAAELDAAGVEMARLAALHDDLGQRLAHLDAAHAAAAVENTGLRRALDAERSGRATTEQGLQRALAVTQAEAERLAAEGEARRAEAAEYAHAVAARDQQLTALHHEIERLRQQTADRGVLAHQANELGATVVALEQQLAAARGDGARAERERAAALEQLEASRRRESELLLVATHEQAALQDAVYALTVERDRLQGDSVAQRAEHDAQQQTIAELQRCLERLDAERTRAEDEQRALARRLTATQHQLDDAAAALRQRETDVAGLHAERQDLAAQLDAARREAEDRQQALDAVQARALEDRAALEAARDDWNAQRAAAQADHVRLTRAFDELRQHAADLQAGGAAATTERAALLGALETERTAAQQLRDEHVTVHADVERLSGEADGLRATVAERDTQLAAVQAREATLRQDATTLQQALAALRTEREALAAQVQERSTQVEQLRVGQAALEHQLALVAATHGEEEQALAKGLEAAREQVAQLDEERNGLRAALAALRQQLHTAQAAQAAETEAALAAAAELRQQNERLTAAGAAVAERLRDTETALAVEAERAATAQAQAHTVGAQHEHVQQQLAAAQAAHAPLEADLAHARTEVGRLTAQVQDNAVERDRLRSAYGAIEEQLAQLAPQIAEQERLRMEEREAARMSGARLEAERAALEERLRHTETAHAAALARVQDDADGLRVDLATLGSERDTLAEQLAGAQQVVATQRAQAEADGRRATALAEQRTQLQQALAAAEQRQAALDGALTQARADIAALRRESEDRGLLADQARALETRVVELEQQLAGVRGEAAQAERQRAALTEELDALRRRQADVGTAAAREQAALRATVDRLTEERQRVEHERQRLEGEHAARIAELDAERAAAAALRATLTRTGEAEQAAAQQLADTQRRANELAAQLRQRDAAIEAANAERQRLTTQVAKLSAHARASQETLDALQGRVALERAALDAERAALTQKQAADQAELQRLVAGNEDLSAHAAQLEAGRTAAAAELAAVRRTLDELRLTRQQAEEALRDQLAVGQTDTQRLSAELLALRGELAEREELLTLLWQEQAAARQADAERQQTIASLRTQLVASTAQAEQAAATSQQLRDEREAVERQLAVIEAACGEEGQMLSQGLQAARAQIAHLEQERGAAHAALADARQHVSRAETAHAEAQARMQTDVTALRQQLSVLTEARTSLTQRAERIEQALQQQSEDAQAERHRAQALAERCAGLEQSLAIAESERTTLDTSVQRMAAEMTGLQRDSADRGALAGRIGDLEEQLAEARRQVAHADQQRGSMTAELDAAHQEQVRALAAAAQQQQTLEALLQQLTGERTQLVAERTAQQHQLDTQRVTLSELHAALEQAQADRQRVEEDGRDTAQRLAEVHRRLDDVGERLRQRDAALEAAAADRYGLEDAVRTADAKAAELSIECETWRQRAEAGGGGRGGPHDADLVADDLVVRVERAIAPPPADAPLEIERSAPLDELLESAPEPADAPPPEAEAPVGLNLAQEMVLLDATGRGDEAFQVLKRAGFEVVRAAPSEAAVENLAARRISCVMLNLAGGPVAWRTLKTLRERTGTRAIPILAYLMGPDNQRGFCFGRADFGIWPMDGQRLTDRLTQLRPKLKRLLAVSADIDGMGRLREPLTKAGISTSSVLDGKQALEFASMVAPEAGLFHLSPSCSGVARAITALRAGESTRDLPMLVLLDKALAREDTFYAMTARELISKGTFLFANLPEEIARLLG